MGSRARKRGSRMGFVSGMSTDVGNSVRGFGFGSVFLLFLVALRNSFW